MSDEAAGQEVTRLLNAAGAQNHVAADQLLTLVYGQLRKMAQQGMCEERSGHTLQATALVHEAYLRLVGDTAIEWQGRAHFYAAAAEAMRRILIEHARKRGAAKRGGGWRRAALTAVDPASDEDCGRLLALEDAILRLESEDARAAKIVRLRFYAGLTIDETVAAMGLSRRTVLRDWEYARAWLAAELGGESADGRTST